MPVPPLIIGGDEVRGSWEMARGRPDPRLDLDVRGYCGYVERGAGPVRRRQVAQPGVTVILSFGEPLRVAHRTGETEQVSFVAGLHDSAVITEHAGLQHGIQVDLTPLGAYRLLGVPMSDVANRVVDLDDIPGWSVGPLVDELGAGSWKERFASLERFLVGRTGGNDPVNPAVGWAWAQLWRSAGRVAVADLAEEIGWSRRHLASRFKEQVGLTPKRAARVLRFARAVRLLGEAGVGRIGHVAAECGYADHSHLTREFTRLAGCSPSELLAAIPAGIDGAASTLPDGDPRR